MTTRPLSDRRSVATSNHERALQQHDRLWREMRRAAIEHGRDSEQYRIAREDMLDAHAQIRPAMLAATGRKDQCPRCGKTL